MSRRAAVEIDPDRKPGLPCCHLLGGDIRVAATEREYAKAVLRVQRRDEFAHGLDRQIGVREREVRRGPGQNTVARGAHALEESGKLPDWYTGYRLFFQNTTREQRTQGGKEFGEPGRLDSERFCPLAQCRGQIVRHIAEEPQLARTDPAQGLEFPEAAFAKTLEAAANAGAGHQQRG